MTQKDFCRKYGFSFRKFDSRNSLLECCLTISRAVPKNEAEYSSIQKEIISSIIEELERKLKQIKADFERVKNES